MASGRFFSDFVSIWEVKLDAKSDKNMLLSRIAKSCILMTLPSKNHTLLVPVAYLIIGIPFGFSLHSMDLLKTVFFKAFMSQACEKVSVLNFVVRFWTPSNLKGVQRIP